MKVSKGLDRKIAAVALGLAFSWNALAEIVALDQNTGAAISLHSLVTADRTTLKLVDKANNAIDISSGSSGEFFSGEEFRLYRGSAIIESKKERKVSTPGAILDYVGKIVVSYDYQEKSTSVFVIKGEARIRNLAKASNSIRVEKFQGATYVAGKSIPDRISGLTATSLQSWMKGYSWPAEEIASVTQQVPAIMADRVEEKTVPSNLKSAKIEDYFSGIDVGDDYDFPDYYKKKFQDPDITVAQENGKMEKPKGLNPEDAALIALPSTKIDLELDLPFQVLTAKEKAKEVENIEKDYGKPTERGRNLASVPGHQKNIHKKVKPLPQKERTEVDEVLDRLNKLAMERQEEASNKNKKVSRSPASATTPEIPKVRKDTIYWENF